MVPCMGGGIRLIRILASALVAIALVGVPASPSAAADRDMSILGYCVLTKPFWAVSSLPRLVNGPYYGPYSWRCEDWGPTVGTRYRTVDYNRACRLEYGTSFAYLKYWSPYGWRCM